MAIAAAGRSPHTRIVEAVSFVAAGPPLVREMTLTATFDAVAGGTEVTLPCENLPSGLRAEGHEAGARMSLEQLARRMERRADC